jgi:hypothetical protein
MSNYRIPEGKAKEICEREGKKLPSNNSDILLKTGAKVAHWRNEFWLLGYEYNGKDVKPYLK